MVVNTLNNGSLWGQSFTQTLDYMKNQCLGANVCHLSQTIALCEEMNHYAERCFDNLYRDIA